MVGSSAMGLVPGNISAVASKTSGLLTKPIFGLFFFALFVPFVSPAGAWIGTFFGTVTAVLVAFSGPLALTLHLLWDVDPATLGTTLVTTVNEAIGDTVRHCPDPVSFQWISPIALTVNIFTGCVASLIFPTKSKD